MKCFLGHIERWNHDITGGTPIKILNLIKHLFSTHWLDIGDSEKAVYLSFLHENRKKMLNRNKVAFPQGVLNITLFILIFGVL